MAASVLEQLRAAHEDVERLEKATAQVLLVQQRLRNSEAIAAGSGDAGGSSTALVTAGGGGGGASNSANSGTAAAGGAVPRVLKGEKKTRELLRLEIAAADLLTRLQERAATCVQLYADVDGLRRDEIAFLAGHRSGGNDVWVNFYEKIRQIKETHKRRALRAAAAGGSAAAADAAEAPRDASAIVDEVLQTPYLDGVFDEEEHCGEMLNLHEHFSAFINLKPARAYKINEAKKAETARLTKKGLSPEEIAEKLSDNRIEEDLVDYITYLKTFHIFNSLPRALKYRCAPYLVYLKNLLAYLQDFFTRRTPLADHAQVQEKFEETFEDEWSKGEIATWKTPTVELPLYCRPTDKLFISDGTRQSHMQGKKYKKALVEYTKMSRAEQEKRDAASREHDKEIAYVEYMVNAYRDILEDVVERTVAFHHKKQSRTAEELEEEGRDSDEEAAEEALGDAEKDSDEEEDDQPVYNPLNLPLGFDGRPIPFWLYKLHGLGQEFKCEICGNFSYWGRRVFERHFMEWRHAFGMRCLRIPNTTHFKEITKIEDAIRLYEKLKKDAESKAFKHEQELECEDSQGNVMSLRAFEDLRRQGLL